MFYGQGDSKSIWLDLIIFSNYYWGSEIPEHGLSLWSYPVRGLVPGSDLEEDMGMYVCLLQGWCDL